jgi:Ca-activated chloride channel family protein
MFSFSHPWCLALLPLLGILFRRIPPPAIVYSDLNLFAGLPHGRARWIPPLRKTIQCLIVGSVIVAAAGLRWPDERSRIPAQSISIVLLLDVSGSMEAETFRWQPGEALISRAEAAKRAFRLFVAGGEGLGKMTFTGRSTIQGTDAIGLVTFALVPYPICPPTLHHSTLLKLLDDVAPRGVLDAGTNIGDALAEGLILLQDAPTEKKVMILLSDGEHNFERDDPDRKPLKPLQAAQLAANLNIPIFTIDTGGDPPPTATPEEIKQRTDGRLINEAIAKRTGGRAFSANDGTELLQVCQELDHLERQDVLSFNYRRYFELGPKLLLLATALSLVLFILDRTWWRILN